MGHSYSASDRLPLLFYADGYRFPDVYHVTRFLSPDAIIALEDGDEIVVVANSLEEGRVRKQSRATSVFNIDEFGAKEISAKGVSREELDANVIARFLVSRNTKRVAVASYFPLGMAERLRGLGIDVTVADDLGERRRLKRQDEIEALDAVQRACEEGWGRGVDAIRRATVRKDQTLELDG
jgi:Xaa-Pro aminopeptidase